MKTIELLIPELSQAIQVLMEGLQRQPSSQEPSETEVMIHVDEIAAKIARFYEQIRNIVDYQEEHLLRKNSIRRALQRELFFRSSDNRSIAESLIREIIRSGHLPNDRIPETRIADVEQILGTLSILLDRTHQITSPIERQELSEWLIRVTSCAIEETLDPPLKDRLMAATMFRALNDRLVIKGEDVTDNDRIAQLFIAVQKTLLNVDDDQLAYRFLKFMYPYWDNPNPIQLDGMANNLSQLKLSVVAYTHDPLRNHFFKLCSHYNTLFLLLGDAIWSTPSFRADSATLFNNPHTLEQAIGEAYQKRYRAQKRHLRRLAFFSIISLFITKVLIALAIEIPIDRWFTHEFSLTATVLNIFFPPILMFIILMLIHLPSKRNVAIVQQEIRSTVYEGERKEYLMVIPKEKRRWNQGIVQLIYGLLSVVVLSGLLKILFSLDFSIASAVVFVLFTSIVAATGVKVHNRSKELSVEPERASLRWFVADVLFTPFVTIGKYTMAGLSKFRFLVILINLIDMPLLVFFQFLENFNVFIRSKKDEVH